MAKEPPTRLLEIFSGGVRLRSTRERGIHPHYVTLSHCWGTIPFFTLKQSNISSLHQSIPVRSLCKTFQDAIMITQRLGFSFIWIDSLCIIQDDEDD
ncbi:HET-domain-containing protein [Acephala macrosclerotiorum]|nr:HET-domain-containing protein [Acephala macrosclerotiorum]